MKLFSRNESVQWCQVRKFSGSTGEIVESSRHTSINKIDFESLPLAKALPFSSELVESLVDWETTLLWVTSWNIWPSSCNWQLYYQFRQSFGDFGLLEEGPGHLFHAYEKSALVSLIQLSILNGWDFWILADSDYSRYQLDHESQLTVWSVDKSAGSKIGEIAAVSVVPPNSGAPRKEP